MQSTEGRDPSLAPAASSIDVVVIYWEWTEGTPHAGAHFWGCHSVTNDGRIEDWPKLGLRPLAAAKVTVVEGAGLELLHAMRPADYAAQQGFDDVAGGGR